MRNVLVVIDMQNDFIDGALGTKEAQAIVSGVAERIRDYKGQLVIATMDTHKDDYMNTSEGRHLPVPHCIKGTKGWEFGEEIAEELEKAEAKIFEKPVFGSEQMAEYLYELAQKEELKIELIGLCTDICVVSNALLLKAKLPETELTVNAECCAGVTPESHQAALLTMKMCQVEIIGKTYI